MGVKAENEYGISKVENLCAVHIRKVYTGKLIRLIGLTEKYNQKKYYLHTRTRTSNDMRSSIFFSFLPFRLRT